MIIITGGAGLIGSAVVWALNKRGQSNILIVDEKDLSQNKQDNLAALRFDGYLEKNELLKKIDNDKFGSGSIDAIIHMGACSDTTETDEAFLMSNNYEYTKTLCEYSIENNVRFIYASSAATYGNGSFGYSDSEDAIDGLTPLNLYGKSKQIFDQWAKNAKLFDRIVGIKYFNIYGPNEYHKGGMRSLVLKAFQQVKDTGKIKLFKSYKSEYADGEQKRDFLYVKDAVKMTLHFLDNKNLGGLYNAGSGTASTWNQLANAIFKAMGKEPNIEYIEMPETIKDKYQYFTQADISKIRHAGYAAPITSLESAVKDYVQNYLINNSHLI